MPEGEGGMKDCFLTRTDPQPIKLSRPQAHPSGYYVRELLLLQSDLGTNDSCCSRTETVMTVIVMVSEKLIVKAPLQGCQFPTGGRLLQTQFAVKVTEVKRVAGEADQSCRDLVASVVGRRGAGDGG